MVFYGLLARYPKLRVRMRREWQECLSPSPQVSDPDMHHGTSVTYVPIRHMRNLQFYVSGKRSMVCMHLGAYNDTSWKWDKSIALLHTFG